MKESSKSLPVTHNAESRTEHQDADRAWNEFVAFLKARGERITTTRERVFRNVMGRHDHFRADELAKELKRRHEGVSRGTVYRTLALMVESGVVRAFRDGDAHYHYEHTFGHQRHEHMICDECGAFVEFDAPELAREIDKRCRQHGFRQRTHRISVFGLCEKCAGHTRGKK